MDSYLNSLTAYCLTMWGIGVIYLAAVHHRERELNPVSLWVAIISPLGMPALGLIALKELIWKRREPKPVAVSPAKPTDPPQDG
jgi:hypothetical protein